VPLPIGTNTPNPFTGVVIVNNVSFGVQFMFWSGPKYVIDVPPGETRTLALPPGMYGWTSFLPHNGCQLNPTDNLEVIEGSPETITMSPSDDECGAELG
jgi:hypothetical protein